MISGDNKMEKPVVDLKIAEVVLDHYGGLLEK